MKLFKKFSISAAVITALISTAGLTQELGENQPLPSIENHILNMDMGIETMDRQMQNDPAGDLGEDTQVRQQVQSQMPQINYTYLGATVYGAYGCQYLAAHSGFVRFTQAGPYWIAQPYFVAGYWNVYGYWVPAHWNPGYYVTYCYGY